MRLRVFWPITLVAAALVGLLAYGVVSKGTDTTLDDAVAKGKRPEAPLAALPWLLADRLRLAGGLQGQGRRAQRLGLLVRPLPRGAAAAAATHEKIESQGGMVLGVDTQDASDKAIAFLKESKATFPSLRDRDREYGRSFGVSGYPETFLIDRSGRVAAMRRFPVTQAWLDEHLPKLLAEKA